jgi:hypothetical protein
MDPYFMKRIMGQDSQDYQDFFRFHLETENKKRKSC